MQIAPRTGWPSILAIIMIAACSWTPRSLPAATGKPTARPARAAAGTATRDRGPRSTPAPAGPDLVYRPADLRLPAPPRPKAPAPGRTDLEEILAPVLQKQPWLAPLLQDVRGRDLAQLRKFLELNDRLKLIKIDGIRELTHRLGGRAGADLRELLDALEPGGTGLPAKWQPRLDHAMANLGMALDLARKSGETPKIGRFAFQLGRSHEMLALNAKTPAARQAAQKQSAAHFDEAARQLRKAPDPVTGLTADDAKLAKLTVEQGVGVLLPLVAPADQTVQMVSDIGMRIHPLKKKRIMHKGIDLAHPSCTGWPIHAIGPGRIVHSGWENGYGYSVVISHTADGKPLFSRYAHLKKAGRPKPGAVLEKGAPIGYCNNTGGSQASHLHFELRTRDLHGDPIDPKPFVYGDQPPNPTP